MENGTMTQFFCRAIYPKGDYPGQPTWDQWTLDYELIHQLVLKALIETVPGFLSDLCPGGSRERTRLIEPSGGLYDIRITAGSVVAEIEIKVWSPLASDQIARQIERIRNSGTRVFYLLLGRTGCQRSRQWVHETTSGLGAKISYRELEASLAGLIGTETTAQFPRELATAYYSALAGC